MKAAEAFTAASEAGEWERAKRVLADAIGACKNADDIEALFTSGGIEDAFFDEDLLWPETVDAIVEKAAALDAKNGALALGWLARAAALVPSFLISPDRKGKDRSRIEHHGDLFRAWSADTSIERRIAGTHLLAWCDNVTAEDLDALLARAKKEKSANVLATDLLTLGVHRMAQARALATSKRKDKSALVRLCAAALLAFLGDVLDDATVASVVDHVKKPSVLPPQWGWYRGEGQMFKTDTIAVALLPWAKTASTESAIDALAKIDLGTIGLGAQYPIADALVKLAFPEIPREGLVLSELTRAQRKAMEALAKGTLNPGAPGIKDTNMWGGSKIVREFLDAKSIEWRPIAIRGKTWHFGRIQAAVVFGDVSQGEAKEIVLRELSIEDALWVASHWSPTRMLLEKTASPEEYARAFDFGLALLEGLRGRPELEMLFRGAADDWGRTAPDIGIVAVACVRMHEDVTPFVRLLARAASQQWWTARVHEEIRKLPEPIVVEILHAIEEPNVYSVDLLWLHLDSITVQRLVLFAAYNPGRGDAIVEKLKTSDASALIRDVKVPPKQEAAVAKVVARILG